MVSTLATPAAIAARVYTAVRWAGNVESVEVVKVLRIRGYRAAVHQSKAICQHKIIPHSAILSVRLQFRTTL